MRNYPAETEPRPALSAWVPEAIEPAAIPFGWILHTTGKEMQAAAARDDRPMFGGPPGFGGPGFGRGPGAPGGRGDRRGGPPPGFGGVRGGPGPGGPFRGRFGGPFGQAPSEPGSFRSAFVYFDPATGKTELFDFIQINGRKGGQKVHLDRDHSLGGMTGFALIFEGETAALVEPLAYEVYRRAGMPVEQSHHVRVWQDGKPTGYSLLVEQPNRAFLRRNGIGDEGNMYKLLWFGGDLIGQHEKHTHRRLGHADLTAVVEGLQKRTGDAQWRFIEEVYTEAAFGPVITAMEERLTPEVRLRAELQGQDPGHAVDRLKSDVARLREHLRLRREFLLAQAELKRIPQAIPGAK